MNFAGHLAGIILIGFRALGLLSMLPLGGGVIMNGQRLLLACGLGLLMKDAAPVWPQAGAAALLGEYLLGLLCGLPAAMLVSCAEMWGDLFDALRGQNIAQMYDSSFEREQAQSGIFARNFLWSNLLLLGVGENLLAGFYRSFSYVNAGAIGHTDWDLTAYRLMHWSVGFMVELFCLFAPIAALFLLIDLAALFSAKLLPHVSLGSEVFQIKSLLGAGLTCLIWVIDLETLTLETLNLCIFDN